MKYQTKTDTFRVRQITEAELIASEDLTARYGEGEFQVRVSPVANGWWTRGELYDLYAKLHQLLNTEVAHQRFEVDGVSVPPEDAAWYGGYLPKPIPESTCEELDAAVAAMLADRARNQESRSNA